MKFRRGDIVLTDLGMSRKGSHVQSGIRPAVIVSSDEYNRKLSTLSVCVMTTRIREDDYCNHIRINYSDVKGHLKQPSVIVIETLTVIDKSSVLAKQGSLYENVEIMKCIDEEIASYLGLKEEKNGAED